MTIAASAFIHQGATVAADVVIGDYVVVYPGAVMETGSEAQGFTQLWPGVTLERDACLGPNVTLEKPVAGQASAISFGAGCRVGAAATIGAGVHIGRGAVVQPGSVISHNVAPFAIMSGSPARIIGYVENIAQQPQSTWHRQADFPAQPATTRLGVGNVTLHRFKLVRDPRGDLSVGEFQREVPFTPQRYFLVFNVPNEKTRGEHAHRECEQFLVCVKGSCAVVVDDNQSRCEVLLESPDMGIYLPPMTWGIQYKYSADAVLLVFTSHPYDAADYIRDYNEFSAEVQRLERA